MRRGEEEGRGGIEEAERKSQGGRIEESKKRETIIDTAIIGLKRKLALGKCPEI